MTLNRLLKRNDLGFSDRQLAAICLTGLPKPKYEITVKTLIAQPNNLQMAVVKQYLLEEEEQENQDEDEEHQVLKVKRNYSRRQTETQNVEERQN
jgi:hypothetical protein